MSRSTPMSCIAPPLSAGKLFHTEQHAAHRKVDQTFMRLLLAQWAFAVLLVLIVSPFTWAGGTRAWHPHLFLAVFGGALINALPIALILTRPGWSGTRHAVVVGQMLWSALLIHITGGRIETHFHVFGSLAFIAMYRDWRLFPTAIVVVSLDHLLRAALWPEAVYGVANPAWWRFLEHAAWVVFESSVLVLGCVRGVSAWRVAAERESTLQQLRHDLERKVEERTQELRAAADRHRALLEGSAAVPWELDLRTETLIYIAPQVEQVLGISLTRLTGLGDAAIHLHPDDVLRVRTAFADFAMGSGENRVGYRVLGDDGSVREVESYLSKIENAARHLIRGVALDVTQQRATERELHQAQKLESVGRLAAGVAHELNTPLQYVSDNLTFARRATTTLIDLVDRYRSTAQLAANQPLVAEQLKRVDAAAGSAQLEFIRSETPKSLAASMEGVDLASSIVQSMRRFAAEQPRDRSLVDLNQAVRDTLALARSDYRDVADATLEAGELPPVDCRPGEINQVLLQLVTNAAQAMRQGSMSRRGLIVVSTRRDGDHAEISVMDNGPGIPDAIRERVFDPFFTTRAVGSGTGQGLAMARRVICEGHGGTLKLDSHLGQGATFIVRLPLRGPARTKAQAVLASVA